MENQEVYNITIEGRKAEAIITHRRGLDEIAPVELKISGNIDSVRRWLEKNKAVNNSASLDLHHVRVCRGSLSITLALYPTSPYNEGSVVGKLVPHEDFKKWGINEGKGWNHDELAEFIKMNRNCFESRPVAMKLSAELKTLKVKVDKEVEASNDNRGNVRAVLAQNVIDSSLPKSFRLKVPVFKGQKAVDFEVELYVNASTFQVTLVSPDANDIVSIVRDTVIDEELSIINEIAPLLTVIEQ